MMPVSYLSITVLRGQAVSGRIYHLAGNSFDASRRRGQLMFMAAMLREEHSLVISGRMLADNNEGKKPGREASPW